MVRVAVIFHRFGPYHCARLEAAACRCEIIGIEVAAETQEYAWSPVQSASSYSRVTLFPRGDTRAMSAQRVARRVKAALRNCAPTAVAVPGWWDNAAIATLRWCVQTATPAILMSESNALDQPRVRVQEWIKRQIVSLCSSALVGGQRHADYLVELGMARDRIFTGYDVVDNQYFGRKTEEIRDQESQTRLKYGLPENYFLASARFIEKKNLDTLIRAYARYLQLAAAKDHRPQSTDNRYWKLVLLGDGPLRKVLNSQLSALNLQDHVNLPGFKQYDELPVYYALAKAFVHASTTEQWGLVVNEALASGLPVIVSERCGCAPELVQENGFTFNPTNERQLAALLLHIASLSDGERKRFGDASRSIAARFGPDRFGEGLKRAAQLAANDPRKASLLGRIAITLLQ
jgi:glycosyltransferase involved in cell wall biosynthesis